MTSTDGHGWLRRRALVAVSVLVGASALVACNPATEVTNSDVTFLPDATPWNGYKVYLSSPRHSSSGSRGECRNPGLEENVNGRGWNYYAATGTYFADAYAPDSPYRSLRARGYQVAVSANSRDDGALANRTASDNWGADVHIVSHTNAYVRCGTSVKRTVAMYESGDTTRGKPLAQSLADKIDAVAPGGQQVVCSGSGCPVDHLIELGAQARWRVYMELIFHTNQESQAWMAGNGSGPSGMERYSWRYGWAIDEALGYPRSSAPAAVAAKSGSVTTERTLDDELGFGRTPAGVERDDTVALWEAYRREQQVAACMSDAGFSYQASPDFPDQGVREVAAGLGVAPAAAAPAAAPATVNDSSPGALARTDRDRYYRTLLGESLEAVEAVERTDEAEVASDYATGGCVGRAAAAVPSIWNARRSVQDELRAIDGQIGDQLTEPYSRCVQRSSGLIASQPGDLEELALSVRTTATERTRAKTALDACGQGWGDGFQALERRYQSGLVANHQVLFESVRNRYDDVISRVEADRGFRAYLSHAVAPR